MYPGEIRIIDDTLYVRGYDGIWRPVDMSGPGYLTDQAMARLITAGGS